MDQPNFLSLINPPKSNKKKDDKHASTENVLTCSNSESYESELFMNEVKDSESQNDSAFLKDTFLHNHDSITDYDVTNGLLDDVVDKENYDLNLNQTPRLILLADKEQISLCNSFSKSIQSTLLCTSPLVEIILPFLLSTQGQSSSMHYYLKTSLFWSKRFDNKKV